MIVDLPGKLGLNRRPCLLICSPEDRFHNQEDSKNILYLVRITHRGEENEILFLFIGAANYQM